MNTEMLKLLQEEQAARCVGILHGLCLSGRLTAGDEEMALREVTEYNARADRYTEALLKGESQ